jgi:hypothetical protein
MSTLESLVESLKNEDIDATYYPKNAANYGKDVIHIKDSPVFRSWEALVSLPEFEDRGLCVKVYDAFEGSEILRTYLQKPEYLIGFVQHVGHTVWTILDGI